MLVKYTHNACKPYTQGGFIECLQTACMLTIKVATKVEFLKCKQTICKQSETQISAYYIACVQNIVMCSFLLPKCMHFVHK